MTSLRTRDRLLGRLRDQGIDSMAVLDVMRSIPRHIFLDEALSHRAYEDVALPIGHNQTISQPYIVARMTEVISTNHRLGRVLEIGTGCGYQTAVLARLASKVITIERIRPLLDRARQKLRSLELRNIVFRHGDGSAGWPERGPYDAIITTAAPQQVPQCLLDQLADGGRMVIPVGSEGMQELRLIQRQGDMFKETMLERVRFVPLLTGHVQH